MENTRPKCAPFGGMPLDALSVLDELKNQETFAWMREHRLRVHSSLRDPFLHYLSGATDRLREEGFDLEGSARTVFRLHRDQRFQRFRPGKGPFHGHIEAVFTKDSQRTPTRASIQVRLDPNGGFLRAGSFRQPPSALRALRESMVAREVRFLELARTLEQRGCGLVAKKILKGPPRGFAGVENPTLAEYLRMVDPTTEQRIEASDWTSGRVIERTVDFALTCRPWLLFLEESGPD